MYLLENLGTSSLFFGREELKPLSLLNIEEGTFQLSVPTLNRMVINLRDAGIIRVLTGEEEPKTPYQLKKARLQQQAAVKPLEFL